MNIEQSIADAALSQTIPKSDFERFKVNTGLRDPETQAGVLVGLTRISSVVGFVVEDQEKIPTEGKLRYRGIEIHDLVNEVQAKGGSGFERIAFLLLSGYLPSDEEYKIFRSKLAEYSTLPENFTKDMILKHPSPDIMNKLQRSVAVLYSYDKNADDLSIENNVRQSINLIAKIPALIAYGYQAFAHKFKEESFHMHHPDLSLGIAEQFLHLIRPDSKYTQLEAEILDLSLMLHAEHGGGNNSSFTVHVTTSSQTDYYSSIVAGLASLKGPRHGGANKSVMAMMDDLKKNIPENMRDNDAAVSAYLAKIIKGEAFDKSGKIYGLGHAVYTLSDPRAEIFREKARALAKEKNRLGEFELYERVRRLAEPVFEEVKGRSQLLRPNVDFYSGFVYDCLNLPPEVFTPLFAMARVAGWSAHRLEELVNSKQIIRPAYKFVKRSK